MATLSDKQQAFIDYYFLCGFNATEAARRASYAHPDVQGPRLLGNVGIRAEISRRMDEHAMPANEVLARLADMARSTMYDFLDDSGEINLKTARERGKLHLIKSRSTTDKGERIELYDAQSALVQLGKAHGLFTDKTEHSGTIGYVVDIGSDTGTADTDTAT